MNTAAVVRPIVRHVPHSRPWAPCPPSTGRRHESTFRRGTKRLRVKPEPSFLKTGSSPQQDHIVFNPPSSAPSVYHTPSIFLPKDDRRRDLAAVAYPSKTSAASKRLPPPVRKPYEKKYHLKEPEIAEIRRLRREDPVTWSREALAKKFECSSLFIGIVCEATKEHKEKQSRIIEAVKSRWGRKRRTAREDRGRRRETWGLDE
ncbi:MAG: hypothetical protein M1832_004743 [Thelocarpon impressellum]|nr:MAG: hypothetical protein M1832_004743 [Thelocarpon impressellum]